MRFSILGLCATLAMPMSAIVTNSAVAADPVAKAGATAGDAKIDRAVLEQLKSLAGRWEGRVDDAAATPVALEMQVTSNGTAVLERVFAGSPHEMTTVYYLAGDELLATHYCSIGNQPGFRLVPGSTPGDITMDFAGGTGFDPRTDQHAHGVRIQALDDGRLRVEWQFRKGEADPTFARMTLQRVADAGAAAPQSAQP